MANKTNIGIGSLIVLLIAAYFGIDLQQGKLEQTAVEHEVVQDSQSQSHFEKTEEKGWSTSGQSDDLTVIAKAFEAKKSNIQVKASGQVKALLRDDNEGSRHQKFILRLQNGQTVLVAHNIDLAPRVENIQKGDVIEFYGEYEYSVQGGVIHWTHLDPNKRHEDGWLKHAGKIYQ